jgi:RNA polymerase sigma-70 factor, ECF subfamily
MSDHDPLSEAFRNHRGRLRAAAYRMLGAPGEADDAVQETWLRLRRADADSIENPGGWLTTVVAHVCLDMLRARTSRAEEPLDAQMPEPADDGGAPAAPANPEDGVLVADAIGTALLVVLDTLAPAERVAFVLHDLFGVPFEDIAPVVGRSPAATRQLASRARRRVQGASTQADVDRTRQREVVRAFLAASRGGDFGALLALLDPDVVLRADGAAQRMGAAAEVRGAPAVAETFKGRAQAARLALVDGAAGAVWSQGGTPRVVFAFTTAGSRIVAIDLLADPARLAGLALVRVDD